MSRQKIVFGVHLPVVMFSHRCPDAKEIQEFAEKAEKSGFDFISVNDHVVFRTGLLDPLISLAIAITATSRIRLGTSILNIVVRHPVLAAHALSSLDVLSSGRLFAGVGPGSAKLDYDVCGIAFHERWSRFTESLEVLKRLWSESPASYRGKFYSLENLVIEPTPIQKPHPPIWIGSWGSDWGLKRVVKYGDGWMASAYNITPERFSERWRKLRFYAEDLSRDPNSIGNAIVTMFTYLSEDQEKARQVAKNILAPALGRAPEELERLLPFGTPEQCIQKIRRLAEAGVQRVHIWPVQDELEQMEIFSGQVMPQFLT
jgi:probable F420-dependent oxidoreductase